MIHDKLLFLLPLHPALLQRYVIMNFDSFAGMLTILVFFNVLFFTISLTIWLAFALVYYFFGCKFIDHFFSHIYRAIDRWHYYGGYNINAQTPTRQPGPPSDPDANYRPK
jgi:hypothetical protein